MSHRKAPSGGKNQTAFRKAIGARDLGVCASCDASRGKWIADHVIPLWKVRDMDLPDSYFWNPDYNGQTLCVPCNTFKTSKEASERAHHNRLSNARTALTGGVSKKSKKQIAKRGFDKTLKKSIDGKVTRR